MKKNTEVLHVTLESGSVGVGGIKSVIGGLLPAQMRKGQFNVSLITPFYDAYAVYAIQKYPTREDFKPVYSNDQLQELGKIKHIYKGQIVESVVVRACAAVIDGKEIYHYMIKPAPKSSVEWIFRIEQDGKNIYQSFNWSESHNRLQYFNGAVAAFLRLHLESKQALVDEIPEFDLIHTHTWHTSLATCLAKELENLPKYQNLIIEAQKIKPLKKIPHAITTIHMLMQEQGQFTSEKSVQDFLESVGLPSNYYLNFPTMSEYFRADHFKQAALALRTADFVTAVSKGLITEMTNGKGWGLDEIFTTLAKENRLQGIANGIPYREFDPTLTENLQEFAFKPHEVAISASKYQIKTELSAKYPQLKKDKKWTMFVARLAPEKGPEMLPLAAQIINEQGGNLIIFCAHVVTEMRDGQRVSKYQGLVDRLRTFDNVLVIDNATEQKLVGKMFKAAIDDVLVTSHNEACGLPPRELMPSGAFTIAPEIQGLPDTVQPFTADGREGTGFLYNDDPVYRNDSLINALIASAKFYREQLSAGTLDQVALRLMNKSKEFDWDAQPVSSYCDLYAQVLAQPLLTFDQLRSTAEILPMPIIPQFSKKRSGSTVDQEAKKEELISVQKTNKRVFVIGPNKCATQSIAQFCEENNIITTHYDGGNLASSIYQNYIDGLPLLSDKYKDCVVFADMENIYDPQGPIYIPQMLFKELDKEYPGSKFILNTRNIENWVTSRCKHFDVQNDKNYLDVVASRYGLSHEDMIAHWKEDIQKHFTAVREYFKDRPQDLLEINIEDPAHVPQLASFLQEQLSVPFDVNKYQHVHKTVDNEAKRQKLTCNMVS